MQRQKSDGVSSGAGPVGELVIEFDSVRPHPIGKVERLVDTGEQRHDIEIVRRGDDHMLR